MERKSNDQVGISVPSVYAYLLTLFGIVIFLQQHYS